MGTMSGLFPRVCEIPEDYTGGVWRVRRGDRLFCVRKIRHIRAQKALWYFNSKVRQIFGLRLDREKKVRSGRV